MTRSLIFKAFLIVSLLVASSFAAQRPSKAKVRFTSGEVSYFSDKKSRWSNLKQDQSVFVHDSIVTETESEATLNLPEGSLLNIRERSSVYFDEFYEENGAFKTNIKVDKGNLKFAAQKQSGNSSFNFKTGTMTIAIRGTEGTISGGSTLLAGLESGAIQVTKNNGESVLIHGGQIVFDKGSLVTMNLQAAGRPEFHERILKLLNNDSLNKDDLQEQIQREDSLFIKSLQEAEKQANCVIDQLPDTISTQEIQIHGHCAKGTEASFFDKPVQFDEIGSFVATVELDSVAIGEKVFQISCSTQRKKFKCAEARTFYKPKEFRAPSIISLSTQTPAIVCDEGLNVEGSYQTPDSAASLIFRIEDSYKSGNLMKKPDGKPHPFAVNIPITDRNGLWNAKMATLEFDADGKKNTIEIPLQINKTCKSVNQTFPIVKINDYDSLACVAYVSIDAMQDDIGIFRTNIDNADGKASILSKNTSTRVKLKKGIHEYMFNVKDQADNESSLTKTLGCFPDKFFSVQIKGNTTKETLYRPYAPPGMGNPKQGNTVSYTLRFNIDVSDVSEIYSVTIKHNGKNILHEVLSQIESLDYDVPVNLYRGKANKLDIVVKHKSGHIATATKVYVVK